MIGKWPLGHSDTEFLPTSQGFDYWYGTPYSNDMPNFFFPDPPYMRGHEIVEHHIDQDLIIQRYTQESLQFIEDNQDKPFFLYLAHNMPHYPVHASDDFQGEATSCDDSGLPYSCGLYADVIAEIDWSTGQILERLDELAGPKDAGDLHIR